MIYINTQPKIELEEAWVTIENPDLSVKEAVKILKDKGNQILEIKDRRIKIYG